MKRIVAATTAAVFLAVSGCEATQPTHEQPTPEVSQEATPGPVVIDLAKVALASLPEAVAKRIPAVARVVTRGYNSNATVVISSSSGVLIDTPKGPAYLGAGHVYLDTVGAPKYTACTDSVVESRAADGGVTMHIGRVAAALSNEPPIDLAVLEPTTPKYADTNRAPLTKTPQDLPQGEKIYFVNFEPTPGGSARDPKNSIGGLSTAAVFSGYVLYDNEGDSGPIHVLTGVGDSFGRVTDNTVRPGASGGAVFRADGTLIGLSIAIAQEPLPIATIENDFGVDIRNQPRETVQVTYVQPVDQEFVSKLQQSSTHEVKVC